MTKLSAEERRMLKARLISKRNEADTEIKKDCPDFSQIVKILNERDEILRQMGVEPLIDYDRPGEIVNVGGYLFLCKRNNHGRNEYALA